MVKRLKKLLSATMALSMTMSLLNLPALAEEATPPPPNPPYVFRYTDGKTIGYFSYACRDDYGEDWNEGDYLLTEENYDSLIGSRTSVVFSGKYSTARHHSIRMYQLDRTDGVEGTDYAYCNDFMTSAISGHMYKRVNLEDSTYFDVSTASYIRGIINAGYWVDWDEEDLARAEEEANEWLSAYAVDRDTQVVLDMRNKDLTPWDPPAVSGNYPGDAEDPVELIDGLTADEAQTATQFAIWGITYDQGDDWPDFVKSEGDSAPYELSEFSNNVKAFRKYLLHQQAEPQSRDELIFSDKYFVEDSAIITTGAGGEGTDIRYNISLRFKLAGEVMEEDELTVTATLGDLELVKDLADLETDENGYYTLTFSDVEITDDFINCIDLVLSGSQYVEGVYFYQAEPVGGGDERDSTQNLVGKAQGYTPVSATAQVDFELGQVEASLFKMDSATDMPLAGAMFDLYARTYVDNTPVDFLIASDLVTDEEGYTPTVTGLPEDYSYFFVETEAPAGYELNDDEHEVDGETFRAEAFNDHELGSLTVTKKVEGVPSWQEFRFRVELDLTEADLFDSGALDPYVNDYYPEAGNLIAPTEEGMDIVPVEVTRTVTFGDLDLEETEAGSWIFAAEFDLSHGDKMKLDGIPVGTAYTVTELEDSMSYQGTVEEAEGFTYEGYDENSEGSVYGDKKAEFINTLYIPTEIALEAIKTVDGETMDPDTEPFSFELSQWDGEDWAYVETVENGEDGIITFEPVGFEEEGTYYFRIAEIEDEGRPWYDYADPIYAKVVVSEDDGILEAKASYWENASVKRGGVTVSSNARLTNGLPYLNNETLTTELSVEKVWEDEGYENLRPQSVLVNLLRDGDVWEEVELSETNDWTHTWEDLSLAYSWNVEEDSVPEGYRSRVDETDTGFVITNTFETPEIPEPQLTDITVNKIWVNDNETVRPASITVELLRDAKTYATAELTAENRWTYTWVGLNEEYEWTVAEVEVPENYTSQVDGYTITNTYEEPAPEPQLTDITVNKVWVNDNETVRPTSITVELLRNGQTYEAVELTAENQWSYTWVGLNEEYEWTVAEVEVPENYTSQVDGYTITNTYEEPAPEPQLTDITVNKVWVNDNERVRPESITVELLRNGESYATAELTAENRWSYTWTDLNEEYEWTVAEVEVPRYYTAEVDGFTITNTYDRPSRPSRPERPEEPEIPEEPEVPEEPEIPEEPEEEEEMAEILEEDVPLSASPEEEEDVLAEIMDEELPMAIAPATGDISLLWLAGAGTSGLGLMGLSLFKKREDEE